MRTGGAFLLVGFGIKCTLREQVEMSKLCAQHRGKIVHVHKKKRAPLKLVVLTLDELRELNKHTLAKASGANIRSDMAQTVCARGRMKRLKTT